MSHCDGHALAVGDIIKDEKDVKDTFDIRREISKSFSSVCYTSQVYSKKEWECKERMHTFCPTWWTVRVLFIRT